MRHPYTFSTLLTELSLVDRSEDTPKYGTVLEGAQEDGGMGVDWPALLRDLGIIGALAVLVIGASVYAIRRALDQWLTFDLEAYKSRLQASNDAQIEHIKAQLTEEVRRAELTAERKLSACQEAYSNLKHIDTCLGAGDLPGALLLLTENDDWLWESRFFLPERFFSLWLSMRNGVLAIAGDPLGPGSGDVLMLARIMADEATLELYDEMGRRRIEVDPRMADLLSALRTPDSGAENSPTEQEKDRPEQPLE